MLIMKLGILLCDQVQEQLQPEFGDYPDMFRDLINKVDDQVEVHFFSAIDRQLPTDIDVCDAYMTSGSRWGVNDDKLWIRELEYFIKLLYDAGKGLVGICFGHQLIAKCLGGKVNKSDKGWGIGVSFSEEVKSQKWMIPAQNKLDLIVSHQDQILALPPQAQVLMSNDFCPYSMIQVGDNFLGIQGHPEFSSSYSLALMYSRKDRIKSSVIDAASAALAHEVDDVVGAKWLIQFLKQNLIRPKESV